MKFFAENQKVEKELEWVMKKVRLHMNGATTGQMEQGGVHYRINYGVGIPHLKELAGQLPVSYELAERLWFLEIRETMLLAALRVPAEDMTAARCKEWAVKIVNTDLIERTALFLWARLPIVDKLLPEWLKGNNHYLKATAYYTIGRLMQRGSSTHYNSAELIASLDKENALVVYKGLSFALRMNMRQQKGDVAVIKNFAEELRKDNDHHKQLIAQELISELAMLDDL
ncbi:MULTISPECIES: DNA alkylation repair protein [unclassified Carboxylicivirga]|uniref:DNA alkylation repair protein n=1 Tax=Carboxylicivirga TaxID=1628153 RepID=UPI003D352985